MRKFIAIFLGVSTLFLASCSPAKNNSSFEENSSASNSALDSASDLGHVHNFVKEIVEDAYKKADANCQHATQYYLSCECGEKGVETFDYGYPLECDFSAKVEEDKYLLSTGTCAKVATYFYSCVNCGQMGTDIFSSERYGEHNFSKENPNLKFLKTEATAESKEVYYKSCKCGAVGTETFEYGEPLRTYKKVFVNSNRVITICSIA